MSFLAPSLAVGNLLGNFAVGNSHEGIERIHHLNSDQKPLVICRFTRGLNLTTQSCFEIVINVPFEGSPMNQSGFN